MRLVVILPHIKRVKFSPVSVKSEMVRGASILYNDRKKKRKPDQNATVLWERRRAGENAESGLDCSAEYVFLARV